MIIFRKQDITTATNGIIMHGVNCQGVMGSGVAAAIRHKWPSVFTNYAAFCGGLLEPSEALGVVQTVSINDDLIIANCFTQLNYGKDGKKYANVDAIDETIEAVLDLARFKDLPVYLPRIGCGLGGLSWETDVYPLLHSAYLSMYLEEGYDTHIVVCDI